MHGEERGAEQMIDVDAKRMSPSQRVPVMEALWESMCYEEDEIDSPDWHEDVLEDRRAKITGGEARFITLKQLRDQLGR